MVVIYCLIGVFVSVFIIVVSVRVIRGCGHLTEMPNRASAPVLYRRPHVLPLGALEMLGLSEFKADTHFPGSDPERAVEEGTNSAHLEMTVRADGATAALVQAPEAAHVGKPPDGPLAIEPGPGCAICLDRFIARQHLRALPCEHRFHSQCVDPWLTGVSASCPVW